MSNDFGRNASTPYDRMKDAIQSLLHPDGSRIQDVVQSLRTRKDMGIDIRDIRCCLPMFSPFVDGAWYVPGDNFPNIVDDFSELNEQQKAELSRLYQERISAIHEKFEV